MALVVIAMGVVVSLRRPPPPVKPEPLNIPGDSGPTVTVEVLNTIGVDGLAGRVTAKLRRSGIDVVAFGSGGGDARTTTEILVRRGDSTAGLRVKRALGMGRVRVVPNAALLLDVSVLVGADAAQAFKLHP
ncbi:MAG TPA: LytR C-terminal domain-containing protein [Gemmatimonadales bacterium]